MYLSRLTPDITSHEFRRDLGDLQHMHRTIMSGFPDTTGDLPPRTEHAVLWRLDQSRSGHVLYVQSRNRPDWEHLGDRLARPAEVRDLAAVLDALRPGRTFSFRLTANPTKRLRPKDQRDQDRAGRKDNRHPILGATAQITWLVNQGQRHGFIIPACSDAKPDVACTSSPRRTGARGASGAITVDPVRFDGHLVVTDTDALAHAITTGIGPAKAYGCGLLSLAPPRG